MDVLHQLFENSNKACNEQNEQRFGALEKFVEENNASSLKQNQQNFGALKTLLEESIEINNKRFGDLEKFYEKSFERDDCGKQCAKDDSCTSVFWSNSSESKCRFNQDKSTIVKFVPGELYYCKNCQTTLYSVIEAVELGVIRLANVAKNKQTQASSFANAMSDPSKAVDGDPNTWFSSAEAVLTKEEPWLMVDLGQRFLVAQIKIHIRTKPIYESKEEYFQFCLVDDFDRKLNPCNHHSEILEVIRHFSEFITPFHVKKVKMGRYLVIKMKEDSLEIVELEVLSVIPIMSYECTSCLAESNTVCNESRIPPVCSCAENHLPVDGDARNGCKDPCIGFKDRNTICQAVSYEEYSCECKNGHFKIFKEEPCFGCLNPCVDFRAQNSLCFPIDAIRYNCRCKQGFDPIHDDPCQGCKKDPCLDFNEANAVCDRVDHETRRCSCNSGFLPVRGDACNGCNDPCFEFRAQNSVCLAKDGIRYNCSCERGFVPIHDNDPCQGCKEEVCPSSLGYKNYGDFGCLKVHKTSKNWEDASSTCKSEGGDLFSPGVKLPLLPKDEMNLESTFNWIGARRKGSGPYKRVNSGGELAEDSQLWGSGEPDRNSQ